MSWYNGTYRPVPLEKKHPEVFRSILDGRIGMSMGDAEVEVRCEKLTTSPRLS